MDKTISEVLEELAARCEAASGPDRELDLLILNRTQPKQYRWAEFGGVPGLAEQREIVVEMEPEWLTDEMRYWWIEQQDQRRCPAYTASLDAAMTLVPEGYHIAKLGEGEEVNPVRNKRAYTGSWHVRLHTPKVGVLHNLEYAHAATPALALTAAALRSAATLARETEAGS